MSITDRLKGLWSRGKYLVSGAALAGAFFGLPSAVNAEETPVEQETETVIEKPSDSTPKVVFRDPEKVEEEIRQIAREIYKPIKIKDFKGDAPADIKQKVKNAIQKRMGEDYRHYNIDLDEIIEEEYDAAKPGLLRQFWHDTGNFFSEKRDHAGDVFGLTADYYRDEPSEDSYKQDLREDHEIGIYFRRLGTDRNAFFLRGEYFEVENKNNSSDGGIYADALFTILGELDKSFFRIQPTIKGGPHDYLGKTSLEIGIDFGKNVQLISCLFGGFTRQDDYYNYEGPWDDSPGTYRWVEVDQRIKNAEAEIAFELAI
ncbi:hypothetical protein KY326_04535, partial [Candidatus Woesearchaeota archaeon]|nr:hypothetical protein [Candidatus Woesearchaeota archaeon]